MNANTPKYPLAAGQTRHQPPLSMWRLSGGQIYISGHGCVDSEGNFPFEDFEGQYRYTMEQLSATLREAGVEFKDIVNVRCYVQRSTDIPFHNALYREYFSAPFPTRTTIVNCLPPGLLFEIECVAKAQEQ
jgi:2-iminobutanoate/2-iminopropanoate deaminase